jgi:hypothetical protein
MTVERESRIKRTPTLSSLTLRSRQNCASFEGPLNSRFSSLRPSLRFSSGLTTSPTPPQTGAKMPRLISLLLVLALARSGLPSCAFLFSVFFSQHQERCSPG